MMSAAPAQSSIQESAASAIRTEPLTTLTLKVRPAAPADAASGSAIIEGGEAAGAGLAGTVLPGVLEWSGDAARGVTHLTLRYGVQIEDGRRLQVIDRASFASTAGTWALPITTTTELESMADPLAEAAHGMDAGLAGLVIGRLDARALGSGALRLELHRVA